MAANDARHVTLAGLIGLFLVCAPGCSAAESPEGAADSQPQTDPRFATLDAFVAYYNEISTREPGDARTALSLIYSETPFQSKVLEDLRRTLPIQELDALMWERFGESFLTSRKRPINAAEGAVRITKSDASRAEGAYIDSEGKPSVAHFVKIGDRWWLSGYTIEYDAEFKRSYEEEPDILRVFQAISEVAPTVIAELRAGTITTAEEARTRVLTLHRK